MLNDRELIAEFVVESKEHLAGMENHLLAIEAAGANAEPAMVDEVFRAVHSIKGAAGFLGLDTLGRLAHEMENVLNLVRNHELVPDASVTDVLLRSTDQLRSLLDEVDRSNERDIADHLAALERIVAGLVAEETPQSSLSPAAAEATASERSVEETAETAIAPAVPQPVSAPAAPRPQEKNTPAAGPTADTSIRVPVNVLDRLMNLAGELVLSRNQLLQMVNVCQARNLNALAARLDQVTSELQETIMQARMQEIETVFGKFPRVVRDLSNALKKQCDLKLEGTDVELDKSIIEAIGDPLTHLIRNAVDHGIEPPEDRVRLGKPAKGTIVLRAYHQAGKVNIAITDNGRGIDAVRLREKAVARGIITPEQARQMSDREALRLIFRPGFSMAEKVTDVSGRGVGMDVVKTNIERLGGTVGVQTEIGAGTTFEIKLPLTLAILPSLIVRCRGQRFAIPQAGIRELVRVKPEETRSRIQRIHDAEVIRLRGELLPLVRLERALDLPPEPDVAGDGSSHRATHVIVVETAHLRYGIVVDGLHDSEEIVVKPLGRHMQDSPCLAGATILGDGRVAMILDVAGIAAHCRLALPDEAGLGGESDDTQRLAERQMALLFRNDPAEWFAVPMDLILRVERIRGDQIDSVGGQKVLQYRGNSLPLLSVDEHLRARPRPEKTQLYVAVYRVLRREVGLIVPELVDIRELGTDVDTVTFRESGVAGSLVVDGRTTRLLDLYELTHAAHPEWFEKRPDLRDDRQRRPVVLLAEDSEFFRKQLAGYLAAEDYEVVACADGQEAWETLCSDPQRFDLVVTDIEMPRMTGLELARHVKSDPASAHLPVIAVSSLAGEDDIQRGNAAGVDEYLVKLDRDQLVEVAGRYLRAAAPR